MVETVIGQVERIETVVRPRVALSVIEHDPDDDRVLEAAREGSADVIASGDRHLLGLGSWETIRTFNVAELLEERERWREARFGEPCVVTAGVVVAVTEILKTTGFRVGLSLHPRRSAASSRE